MLNVGGFTMKSCIEFLVMDTVIFSSASTFSVAVKAAPLLFSSPATRAWYEMEWNGREILVWKMPEWNGMEGFKSGIEDNLPYFHTNSY